MGGSVLFPRVVQVVGGDQRNSQVFGNSDQIRHHALFNTQPVVHQFDKVVIFAKNFAELARGFDRFVVLAEAQTRLHLATGTPCGGDNTRGVLGEQIPIHPGFEVVALQRGQGRHPEEVMHSLCCLGQ